MTEKYAPGYARDIRSTRNLAHETLYRLYTGNGDTARAMKGRELTDSALQEDDCTILKF